MIDVVLLRHGPTAWNEQGRFQGHVDVPLAPGARAWLRRHRLPARFAGYRAWASPLGRARDTARALGLRDVATDPRLLEMAWGDWEGRTRASIAAELGPALAALEARGPDFRPPGGESPRELQVRLRDWLESVAAEGRPVVAVTHKGVIKAALGIAFDWDLTGKAPCKLRWACCHRFGYRAPGRLELAEPNLALVEAGDPPR